MTESSFGGASTLAGTDTSTLSNVSFLGSDQRVQDAGADGAANLHADPETPPPEHHHEHEEDLLDQLVRRHGGNNKNSNTSFFKLGERADRGSIHRENHLFSSDASGLLFSHSSSCGRLLPHGGGDTLDAELMRKSESSFFQSKGSIRPHSSGRASTASTSGAGRSSTFQGIGRAICRSNTPMTTELGNLVRDFS